MDQRSCFFVDKKPTIMFFLKSVIDKYFAILNKTGVVIIFISFNNNRVIQDVRGTLRMF